MKKRLFIILLSAIMVTSLAACQKNEQQTETTAAAAATADDSDTAHFVAPVVATNSQGDLPSLPDTGEVVTKANVTSNGAIDASGVFTDRDLKQSIDTEGAVAYTLADNNNITINAEGVYIISGSASNASIIVEAGDSDKVQIVLNGVSINNTSAPAIYVKSADKVFVTTVSGTESTLNVTGTFSADGDTNTDAVIFSKDDLVLNGLGTLNINSTDNGVSSKDDLKITGGTISINATSDAIEANDSIEIADGTINLDSSKDGLHAENDEDNSKGYIYICGGTFNINAASDGIQATTVAQIDGGTINITASEGIEGTFVQINGGSVNINASDDGINGSNKSSAYTPTIEINNGDVTVNMGQGDTDALDVNGNLYINGGNINITAQSPFDYDGEGKLNGGTVTVNGSQVTQLTNQMMGGGMGGMRGGMGGFNQNDGMNQMPGGFGGGF